MSSQEDPRLGVFLEALRNGHTVDSARKEASLNWKLLYNLRKTNPVFRDSWDQAVGVGGRVRSKVKTMTAENVDRFLGALSGGASVSAAADGSGINSASFYKRRHRDPEFAKLWTEAGERGREASRIRWRENEAALFLREIRAGKSSKEASLVAGKDLTTFYRLKRRDPLFANEWDEAARVAREARTLGRGANGEFPASRRAPKPLSGSDWGGLSWSGGDADQGSGGHGDGPGKGGHGDGASRGGHGDGPGRGGHGDGDGAPEED
ncbi:MAG: hypothetical protein LBG06_06175 [Deltaproteobacteria bacterium]|jgi:hypothetical protein|nr:hypothetical protein [Deltaproteobacteria bacterium]